MEQESWEFVCVYINEGISAASTAKREGFKKMVADTSGGKIGLIATKSASLFVRLAPDHHPAQGQGN
ncbi:MAG: hypothetical protein LBU32_02885 [Clostridiales bacterium]|jgi:hypothetical protein|nr:hypothetical protein [Clostridiales bacterium]